MLAANKSNMKALTFSWANDEEEEEENSFAGLCIRDSNEPINNVPILSIIFFFEMVLDNFLKYFICDFPSSFYSSH